MYNPCDSLVKEKLSVFKFTQSFGGNNLNWIDYSHASWFLSDERQKSAFGHTIPDSVFPARIFTANLTIDTLKKARLLILNYYDVGLAIGFRVQSIREGSLILKKFITSYRVREPFRYYFLDRTNLFIEYLNQPLGMPFKNIRYPINVGCALWASFMNYSIFIMGAILSVLLCFMIKRNLRLLFLLIPIFFILFFFPFILENIEGRRIAAAYPFMLIVSVQFFLEAFFARSVKLYVGVVSLSILFWMACKFTLIYLRMM